jgi:hypothetical protein
VDTCGSTLDTVLSIHTGCPGGTRNQIACSDDVTVFTCLNTRNSSITFDADAGETYLIRVAGHAGASGSFRLNTRYLTAGNNTCESASTVHDGSYTFTNCAATTDGPDESPCFGAGDPTVNNDLWFRYNSTVNGTLTVSTCTSPSPTFDTKLAAYLSACPGGAAGTAIACSDDACGALSSITFRCLYGQSYLIRVGGYLSARGSGLLVITSTPGCGSADFNCDGDVGTDIDIAEFFNCLAGICPPAPCPSSADFNGDGDVGTDRDIEAFFRVLAGGNC